MKLQDLVKATKTLETLSNDKINVRLAYKIMKVLKETKNDVDFYQEKGAEIIKKFAEKDDKGEIKLSPDGRDIVLQKDKIDDFNKEYTELNDTEVKIPEIKFEIEELEEVKLSALDLMSIEEFLN